MSTEENTKVSGKKRPFSETEDPNRESEPSPKVQRTQLEKKPQHVVITKPDKAELDDDDNDIKMDEDNKNDNNNNTPIVSSRATELQLKIIKQVEYYFSKSNILFDDHMLKIVKQNDGKFPLKSLLAFNKLRKNLNVTKKTQLVEALIHSKKLKLDENQNNILVDLNFEEVSNEKKDIIDRTMFATGFHPRHTAELIHKYWSSKGDINKVQLIKTKSSPGYNEKDKKIIKYLFKGSCYVEWKTQELYNKYCGLAFECYGRQIKTAPHHFSKYYLQVHNETIPFIPNVSLKIENLPNHATYLDIKNFLSCIRLREYDNKKCSINFVYKNLGESYCYVRINRQFNAKLCIKDFKQKAIMGIIPKVTVLNNEEAKEIWYLIAVRRNYAPVQAVELPKVTKGDGNTNNNDKTMKEKDNVNVNVNENKKESSNDVEMN